MDNKAILILLVAVFMQSCKNDEPILRDFPMINTLSVTNIDSTGATFRGELQKRGKISTTSYGFLWDMNDPTFTSSHRAIVGTNLQGGTFEFRLDSSIFNTYGYKVRTFATYGKNIVYGNIQSFTSKGNKTSPWSLMIDTPNVEISYSNSINSFVSDGNGYIIDNSYSKNYIYTPQNSSISISHDSRIPIFSANVFELNNILYTYNINDNYMYKYENKIWNKIPSSFQIINNYWFSNFSEIVISNYFFLIDNYTIYKYDLNSNIWSQTFSTFYYGSIIGKTVLNNNAYFLTSNSAVLEFNPNNNTFKIITQYPGVILDKVESFSYNNKIYFGLGIQNGLYTDLWAYDLGSNTWQKTEKCPAQSQQNGYSIFNVAFFIKEKLNLCYVYQSIYNNNTIINTWKFDPSKSNIN